MFGTLLEALGTIGIVIVLVVFFLIRREDLRDRFIHLAGKGHVTVTTQMLEDANTRVSHYLSMLFLVNVAFGISVGIGLYLIGVPSAILWGILAATLRFIPYIGPWIAAAMPIGLSMAISTGWAAPLLTAALFVVLELFNNNFLEPWLYGKHTGVSAVAVLVAAVFWLWLWGPVGLLLATPLTVCLLVVGKHVPQLSFLDVVLGNEPVFEPKKRIYQRLVAGDQEEADELLEDLLEHESLIEVYDSVLIPALAMVETHWHRGEFNDGKHNLVLESLREMIQDRIDRQQEMQAQQKTDDSPKANGTPRLIDLRDNPELRILSLPARSDADEIAAMMVAQVLDTSGCIVQTVSLTSLASEMVELVEQVPGRRRLHFRHSSRRGDACSIPLQAPPRPVSDSEADRGIVGRKRRPGQGKRAHRLWRDSCREVVGRASTSLSIGPELLAADRATSIAEAQSVGYGRG